MPTTYKRCSQERGKWSEENLVSAMEVVVNGEMGSNAAARAYGIPARTLRRRLQTNNSLKGAMGPSSCLGVVNEKKLVQHILKLQNCGFAPRYTDLQKMAFEFAVALNIPHKFKNGMAGKDWLRSFLRRNPELSVRKAESVSLARGLGMTRARVNSYFDLLQSVLQKYNLFEKPGHIFNMDETGLQLNNNPGHVIAKKGSKNVSAISSGEKGETITVIGCCNAEGTFLPPTCIFKGKNLKAEYQDGLPPGSRVYMNQKSAYINSDLFFDWLKNHFLPRKPDGPVLLVVDGHSSHCNVEMLEYAQEQNVVMISFPSHTTHWLQPLDRAVFKSLKSAYNVATNNWIRTNPSRKIGRLQFGPLLNEAWCKAAVPKNGISAFRSTGIFPYNPSVIPDYAFLSDNSAPSRPESPQQRIRDSQTPEPENDENVKPAKTTNAQESSIQLGPSSCSSKNYEEPMASTSITITITPGKILDQVSPPPKLKAMESARKRGQHVSMVLTDSNNIQQKKQKAKQPINSKGKEKVKKKANQRAKVNRSSSSESEGDIPVLEDDDNSDEVSNENECAGCGEDYYKTMKKDDWIQCLHCSHWLHEGCSKYEHLCDICGKFMTEKKRLN